MVPLNCLLTLNSLKPSLKGLTALSKQIGCNGVYPFCISSQDPFEIRGRMFAPISANNEDVKGTRKM